MFCCIINRCGERIEQDAETSGKWSSTGIPHSVSPAFFHGNMAQMNFASEVDEFAQVTQIFLGFNADDTDTAARRSKGKYRVGTCDDARRDDILREMLASVLHDSHSVVFSTNLLVEGAFQLMMHTQTMEKARRLFRTSSNGLPDIGDAVDLMHDFPTTLLVPMFWQKPNTESEILKFRSLSHSIAEFVYIRYGSRGLLDAITCLDNITVFSQRHQAILPWKEKVWQFERRWRTAEQAKSSQVTSAQSLGGLMKLFKPLDILAVALVLLLSVIRAGCALLSAYAMRRLFRIQRDGSGVQEEPAQALTMILYYGLLPVTWLLQVMLHTAAHSLTQAITNRASERLYCHVIDLECGAAASSHLSLRRDLHPASEVVKWINDVIELLSTCLVSSVYAAVMLASCLTFIGLMFRPLALCLLLGLLLTYLPMRRASHQRHDAVFYAGVSRQAHVRLLEDARRSSNLRWRSKLDTHWTNLVGVVSDSMKPEHVWHRVAPEQFIFTTSISFFALCAIATHFHTPRLDTSSVVTSCYLLMHILWSLGQVIRAERDIHKGWTSWKSMCQYLTQSDRTGNGADVQPSVLEDHSASDTDSDIEPPTQLRVPVTSPSGATVAVCAQYVCSNSSSGWLQDLSFLIHLGESVVIVGKGECGKTALVHAMAGKVPIQRGRLCVKRQEQQDLGELHANTPILNMSFLENIRLGTGLVTQNDFRQAVLRAGLLPLVRKLPSGIRTKLSEHKLSILDRQRIGLARVLLARPSIILCDEATKGLSPAQARGFLCSLLKGASRSSSTVILTLPDEHIMLARLFDQIMVLSHGRLRTMGRHDNLMETSGYYRLLIESVSNYMYVLADPEVRDRQEECFNTAMAQAVLGGDTDLLEFDGAWLSGMSV